MPRFLTRFSAAALAFVFTFSSLQFSAENLEEFNFLSINSVESFQVPLTPAPTDNPAGGEGGGESKQNDKNTTTFSTLGKSQAELTAQEMRGYQSLYEMQAEL